MSLISIIIPVYNVERFIERCIDSILAQTFGDFELILINDGSSDRSGEICDEYAQRDGRVRVIHKNNGGVSTARNRGLDLATGRYICFVDSDDWIDPTFLVDFKVDEYDADIYISGALYDIDNRVYSYKKYEAVYTKDRAEIGAEFTRQDIWQNGYPWGKLYKTDIIKSNNLRFDEELSIHEDHVFVFEYYTHVGSLYLTDSAGYHYLVIDPSSRKLSGRVNSYDELLKSSGRFESLLEPISINFSLKSEVSLHLFNQHVIGIRLRSLSSLFLAKCIDRYKKYTEEVGFWREYIAEYGLEFKGLYGLILNILVKTPRPLSYMIIALILQVKHHLPRRDVLAVIEQDLAGRSTVNNKID
ncbi:MAG: glycosyltransferase [Rikenellaceae bacterium]